MHLLHTTTKKLEEFVNPPDYAILSHRWREEEVLFADIHQEHAKGMKGYAKVEGCCEQAQRDGYQYIWIDTCCIDKNSSAALAEAINSMFKWYEDAQICYVYLDDVTDNGDSETESAFAKSEWFTRGWTLQELLAPTSLFFFDSRWREIGSKNSLAGLLSSITRVHVDVLTRVNAGSDKLAASRDSFSVATKMSWAAGRKTTRPEDRAYSLMGIFRVHMPVIYGEGEKKAFFRLQLEIMRTSHDQSIFAWSNPSAGGYKNGTWPFALYPDCFAKSGNVEDVPSDEWIRYSQFIGLDVPRLDFAATNDGLDISLPLRPLVNESDEFIALLSCRRRISDREYRNVGIRLRRSVANAERYERIDAHTLEDIVDTHKEFKIKRIHISYPLLSDSFNGTFFSNSTSLFIRHVGVEEHGFSVIDMETDPSCDLQIHDSDIVLLMRRPILPPKPVQNLKCPHHLPWNMDSSWLASFTYHDSTTKEQFVVTVGISWVKDGGPWLRITSEKPPADQLSQLKIDWTSSLLKAGKKVTASVKNGGHASVGKKRSIVFDRYSVTITVYGDL